jgi:hypothetical protein
VCLCGGQGDSRDQLWRKRAKEMVLEFGELLPQPNPAKTERLHARCIPWANCMSDTDAVGHQILSITRASVSQWVTKVCMLHEPANILSTDAVGST